MEQGFLPFVRAEAYTHRRSRPRKPSPAWLFANEVRRLSSSLALLAKQLQRLEAELARTAQERRDIGETLGRILRAQVETRRALGQTELHTLPRHTRRRPLGD